MPSETPITPPPGQPAQQAAQPFPAQPVPAKPTPKHPPPHLAQDEPASKHARMKSFRKESVQQPWRPPASLALAQSAQPMQSAQPAAQSAQPAHCAAQPAQQPKKPKIVDTVTDFHDIDWSFPLHEQLNPRLNGHPPRNMVELNLRGGRKESVADSQATSM